MKTAILIISLLLAGFAVRTSIASAWAQDPTSEAINKLAKMAAS